jgi:hypothetical protein
MLADAVAKSQSTQGKQTHDAVLEQLTPGQMEDQRKLNQKEKQMVNKWFTGCIVVWIFT